MVQIETSLGNPFTFKRLSGNYASKDSTRVIAFPVLGYLFALSVSAINKIIPCPALNLHFENGAGTIDLGQQTITIINLGSKLNSQQFTQVKANQSQNCFLILIQTITGEPCAIFVELAPLLIEIPLKNIRPIPSSYPQIGKLNFVTHMAILSQAELKEPLKIFLIGMNQIIARKLGVSLPKTSLLVTQTQTQRFLPVVLGSQQALFPIDSISCMIKISLEEIYPTPALPEWVLGFYNWKGQTLRLIDFDLLMGYPPLFSHQLSKIPVAVVLKLHDRFFAFLVANVFEVQSYQLNEMKAIEEDRCPPPIKNFVKGVFPGLRWVINLERLSKTLQSLDKEYNFN